MLDLKNTGMNSIKIIRALWGGNKDTLKEVPPVPLFGSEEIVYVWGIHLEKELKKHGYTTVLINEDLYPYFNDYKTEYGKKLIALDIALKEFGEVILLDWDNLPLRPLDAKFFNYLKDKPIQCPLYSQHVDTANSFFESDRREHIPQKALELFNIIERELKKYSWKFNKEMLLTPNFSFVYSRVKTLGEELIKIALDNKIEGCVEEHAMFLYSKCSYQEYLKNYQPLVVEGVAQDIEILNVPVCRVQREFNQYVDSILPMDLYFKHDI